MLLNYVSCFELPEEVFSQLFPGKINENVDTAADVRGDASQQVSVSTSTFDQKLNVDTQAQYKPSSDLHMLNFRVIEGVESANMHKIMVSV